MASLSSRQTGNVPVRHSSIPSDKTTGASSSGQRPVLGSATAVRVRLTRKLAELLNGIDVSRRTEGDVIVLPVRDAELLIAEGWASRTNGRASDTTKQRKSVHSTRSRKR